jgi:hypothetical protein
LYETPLRILQIDVPSPLPCAGVAVDLPELRTDATGQTLSAQRCYRDIQGPNRCEEAVRMNHHKKVSAFAAEVGIKIMDSPRFRKILREIVLEVMVQQEAERNQNAVTAFLDCCQADGVKASVANGKIYFDEPGRLSASLLAVLRVYRGPITGHLQKLKDREDRLNPLPEPLPIKPEPNGRQNEQAANRNTTQTTPGAGR